RPDQRPAVRGHQQQQGTRRRPPRLSVVGQQLGLRSQRANLLLPPQRHQRGLRRRQRPVRDREHQLLDPAAASHPVRRRWTSPATAAASLLGEPPPPAPERPTRPPFGGRAASFRPRVSCPVFTSGWHALNAVKGVAMLASAATPFAMLRACHPERLSIYRGL